MAHVQALLGLLLGDALGGHDLTGGGVHQPDVQPHPGGLGLYPYIANSAQLAAQPAADAAAHPALLLSELVDAADDHQLDAQKLADLGGALRGDGAGESHGLLLEHRLQLLALDDDELAGLDQRGGQHVGHARADVPGAVPSLVVEVHHRQPFLQSAAGLGLGGGDGRQGAGRDQYDRQCLFHPMLPILWLLGLRAFATTKALSHQGCSFWIIVP